MKLELLRSLLDGEPSDLINRDADLSAISKELRGDDLEGLGLLPTHVWNIQTDQPIEIMERTFDKNRPSPWSVSEGWLGASALMESSAVAAQLVAFFVWPNKIAAKPLIYRGAQRLFLDAVRQYLPQFYSEKNMDDFDRRMVSAFGKTHPPLANLFDAVLDDVDRKFWSEFKRGDVSRDVLDEMVHSWDLLTQLAYLFCSVVDLALSTPLGEAFRGMKDRNRLGWHDIHPGWRFVRSISLMTSILSQGDGNEILHTWMNDPESLQTEISEQLGWPRRHNMRAPIEQWADWLESVRQTGTTYSPDITRSVARSLHVSLGLVRPNAWLRVTQVLEDSARHITLERGLGRRESAFSEWPEHWQEAYTYDQSITVDWRSGQCLWEIHPDRLSSSEVRSVDDYPAMLAELLRDLPLAEALRTEFFHLHVLRLLFKGSQGQDPREELIDRVCAQDCRVRSEVVSATDELFNDVWQYYIG